MTLFRRAKGEAYAALRKRMVRETEAALLYGVLFPGRVPRIPTVEVGRARFDPRFSEQWWTRVLDGDEGILPRRIGARLVSRR